MNERRRIVPSGLRLALALLRRNRDFSRLYLAQLVSFAGDWFATVALVGLVFDLTGSAAVTALALSIQLLGFAAFSPLGGYLADRINRQWLMVASDVARAVLVLGLLFVDQPGEVWVALGIVGAVSALGALFEPTSSAAVPNLVDEDDLPVASAPPTESTPGCSLHWRRRSATPERIIGCSPCSR